MFNTYPKAGVDRDGSSLTNYYERRGRIPAFASLSIYEYGTEIVGEPGSTERLQTMRVSPDFFSTLGLGPAIGRTFTDDETTSETDHVAILSDSVLAGTIQRRSQGDWKADSRKQRPQNRDRRLASRLPLSLFRYPSVPPACVAA